MRARIFAEENRKWWTLGAVAFGLFMIMLDNTVVFVALSSIQEDLQISTSELQWVVTGYALTFAVLMLSGGKLADMFGRRRLFIVGLVIFTAASLACGLATGAESLIGARVVQGVGSALINPATLSIITATFPPTTARDGDRHLGRRLGDGPRDRAARRRSADRAHQLELDLLHQHPGRHRRHHRRPVRDRRVARRVGGAAARPARSDLLGRRALRAHVRPDRSERLRLDVGPHPRQLRRRGPCAGDVRPPRAPSARADARSVALQGRRRSPGRTW